MSRVRSFRRAFGIAVAMLVPLWLLQPLGCATGGGADSDSGLGSGGDFDGEPPADTGPKSDGTPPGFDSAPPPFDGGVDTGHTIDTGIMDSGGMDTSKPHKDAGPKDTGPPDTGTCVTVAVSGTGGLATCTPTGSACGDIGTIGTLPAWVAPSGLHQGLCTTAQVTTIFNDCLGDAGTAAKCTAVQKADPKCYGCIFTTEGAAAYGPVIETTNGGAVEINQGGCIDLLEPCNLACAEASQSIIGCENAACEPNCPTITTSAEATEFIDCLSAADTCDPGGCDTYTTEATNCGALLTGATHPASVCIATSTDTFEDLFNAVVPVFCGK
jgi:hypothetical protein